MFDMKNMKGMMKQFQDMQNSMNKIKEDLDTSEYTGEAGGGVVKVTIHGNGNLKRVNVSEKLLDPENKEILEDLIVAAFNNAKKDADSDSELKLNDLMAGIKLPDGFKFPKE